MGVVDQLLVEPLRRAGLRFSFFEKSENQLFFAIQLFFYSIKHFFEDASGSIPGASGKSDI